MYCSNCGSQVGDQEKYCKACGAPVSVQAAVNVVQQPAPVPQPVAQPVPQSVAQPVQQPVPQLIPQPVPVMQPVAQTQPQTAVYPQQNAQAAQKPVKKSKWMAIVALILGVLTMDISYFLIINLVALITGIPALTLAIFSLVRKNSGLKAMAVIGLITGLLGLLYTGLTWAAMGSSEISSLFGPLFDYLY